MGRARWLMVMTALMSLGGTAMCGSAWAATAQVITVFEPSEELGGDPLDYAAPALLAKPGEANRVRVTSGPTKDIVLFEDLGSTLTVGAGCVLIDIHHARCENKEGYGAYVSAGDLADVVIANPGVPLDAHGGPGTDQLLGADGFDKLYADGGTGEVLLGFGGDDVLSDGDGAGGVPVDADRLEGGDGRDTVSYATRTAPVLVDLSDTATDGQAAEGDQLTTLENIDGGRGDDKLTGTDAKNVLTGGAGKDVISTGAGADRADGGAGADKVTTGAGSDTVVGGKGNDRISLGAGNDLVDDTDQRTPTGNDQINCGDGKDRVAATQDKSIDKLARNCERFTAAEAIVDLNQIFDSYAVTVRLGGVRRSGSIVLVPVKCERAKVLAPCRITGQLKGPNGGATLGNAIARVTVKEGKSGTVRMRLTAAGLKRARRGKKVRLLIADRTPKSAFELDVQARALARIFVR